MLATKLFINVSPFSWNVSAFFPISQNFRPVLTWLFLAYSRMSKRKDEKTEDTESYVYWTVHHLTSWINWTNLMSLYEGFLLLNMFRMLLHSSSGAGDCMWVYCSVQVGAQSAPTCTRIPPYSSRTVPIHQYTPKQSSTHTYNRQLLRMNVIAFETCWAIKNLHKVTSSWFNLFN